MDLPESKERLKHFKTRYKKTEIIPISADQGEGLDRLKTRLGEIILDEKFAPAA
jgi:50S ribosomal subunit-associated GTPase HflX